MKKFVWIVLTVVCLAFTAPVTSLAANGQVHVAAVEATTVNVNSASAKELQILPGIGRVTAERIVAYRSEHGNFSRSEDLIKVKGIGSKTLEKIREQVSME